MRNVRILGVMTGTSCDGLDAACIEAGPHGWKPLWAASAPYPQSLRNRVLKAQIPGNKRTLHDWTLLHRDLGRWYGTSLSQILKKRKGLPDAIACHGQTVTHFPSEGVTLQMGDPSLIANATGLTVVTSFREGDLAAGGQGAPLVPIFHRLLARSLGGFSKGLSIHNIGGISNLTYLSPNSEPLAFDTGPGNLWIDGAVSHISRGKLKMDRDGKLALSGTPDMQAVKAILKHSYFSKPAPKSTGRDEFPMRLLLSKTRAQGADLVATATTLSVESMTLAYRRFILDRDKPLRAIYVCGGGARNPALIQGLSSRLTKVRVESLDEHGYDSQLIEAQAFAYFGFLALQGQPLGGSWTGAKTFGPPAHIIPGKNWMQVMTKLRGIQSRR